MERSQLAIIIPALNEESTIQKVIEGASYFGTVILVDDGSSDETGTIAKILGAKVVRHHKNKGYDAALNTGFKEACKDGFEYFLTLDADGQHNTQLITNIINEFKNGADVVSAIRDRKQRVGEYVFDFYTRFLFSIKDPLCGMKAYKLNVYKKFGCFCTFNSIGTELLINSALTGFKISQIQITTSAREDKSRFRGAIIGNYKILRALFITIAKNISMKLKSTIC